MLPFYTTKDFHITKSGGFEGESSPVEYIFVHTETDDLGMGFRVYQTIENGNGSTRPIADFTYPGKRATRRQVCQHFSWMQSQMH